MHNLVAFARARADDAEKGLTVRFPENLELFDELWKTRPGVTSLRFGGSVTVAEHEYWADEDILAVYGEDSGEV
jgi:hypothetical protein